MEYTPKYFESHAHYDDKVYNSDRDKLLSSLPDYDVGIVINSGARIDGSKKGLLLAEKYPFIYAAVGVHPHDVKTLKDKDIDTLDGLLEHKKAVAVGEIGLDYYYEHSPRETQQYWFKEQIKLALNKNLPMIIHSRDAALDTYNIIANSGAEKVAGVIHCFSGSYELAAQYVKMGFYIGIGGVVTYKNAKNVVEVVKRIPLSSLLLETDCPYLSPEPNRGKRNDSKNLSYIADKIAQIKGITRLDVIKTTYENGLKLFGIESV